MAGIDWSPEYRLTPVDRAKAVIEKLVRLMHKSDFQKKVGLEVTEVFKGGSLGHGTAVEDHFDIDLVLYSRSLSVDSAAKHGYDHYFVKIDSCLREEFGDNYRPKKEHTDVALKFDINEYGDHDIGVDLILSPYFSSQDGLLRSLRDVKLSKRLKMFSASASKWQTDFLRHKNLWIKELIRRAKAWKNIEWKEEKKGQPKSYFISILVIIAYDRLPPDMRVMRKRGLRKLIQRMTREFKELIREIQHNPHLDLSVPGADPRLQGEYRDLLPDRPRIIDPVNPANNLYLSGIMQSKKGEDKWANFGWKIGSFNLSPKILVQHKREFGS